MSKINWSEDELEFLESNYLIKSDEEIAEILHKKVSEVKKARTCYGFKKQRQTSNRQLITDDGMKWCWYCNKFHDLGMFNKNKSKPSGYQDECQIAQRKIVHDRNNKRNKVKNENDLKEKKCDKCGKTLPISQFIKNVSTKDGYSNKCKNCMNENLKEKRYINKGE